MGIDMAVQIWITYNKMEYPSLVTVRLLSDKMCTIFSEQVLITRSKLWNLKNKSNKTNPY